MNDFFRLASYGVGLACMTNLAQAQESAGHTLPILAQSPLADVTQSRPWAGFYFGSEITALSGKDSGGHWGGAGFIGFNHETANNIVLGIQAGAGFAPSLHPHGSFTGYDYINSNIKVGYDMGRWMPYVTTGLVLAKPNGFGGSGFSSPSDSINNVFSGTSNTKTLGRVGAGVDYKLTDKLTIGVAVSAFSGKAGFVP